MNRLGLPLIAFVLATGCVPATGTIVEVQGPMGTTSTAAGITKLELVAAYPSFCGRWIKDGSASLKTANVSGRDLDKLPYDFLVEPSHQTDLTQPAYLAVLAYAATGELVGVASVGAHAFVKDQVDKRVARVALFAATVVETGGPKYIASDGACMCVPGQPWVGNASGTGCDQRVITSFARLGDTAGCELTPKGAPLPVPVCDGQQYLDEPTDRTLPCWAGDAAGACRMSSRRCTDHDGRAWAAECVTGDGDFALPAGSTECAKYLACEQTACGDVTGCFVASLGTPVNVACTLRVDPTTQPGQPIVPCTGTNWKAAFPGQTSCVAAMVQGLAQPPYTIGLAVDAGTAQAMATACPLALQIDAIDAPYPMAIPATKTVDVVVGDHLLHVTLNVELSCPANAAPLTCRMM